MSFINFLSIEATPIDEALETPQNLQQESQSRQQELI